MDLEIDGLRLELDPKRGVVRAHLPSGGFQEKAGVEAVLLFAILEQLKKLNEG